MSNGSTDAIANALFCLHVKKCPMPAAVGILPVWLELTTYGS
jgi:hypothetical protein